MAAVMVLMGVLSMRSMQVDIFPAIDIPVVAVVWTYPGLSAEDMEKRVVLLSERGLSSVVNGIERIESSSIPGIGLLRVYFQPGTDIGNAIAQIVSSAWVMLSVGRAPGTNEHARNDEEHRDHEDELLQLRAEVG